MEDFASAHHDTLSGGEQRRVAIASLLAQAPQVFLLDEPTNHLDPHHQIAVLELFRAQANAGRTVIATLHDPTLAARFADRVILLFGDGRWRAGAAREALTSEALSELYLTPMLGDRRRTGRRVFVNALNAIASRTAACSTPLRGEHGRGLEPDFAALQIRERAAGFAHDHRERGDVEDVTSDSITTSSEPRASRW